jgi:leucyl-tRNA synthetase
VVTVETQGLELRRVTHRMIKRVTDDMARMGFNTAIASMMETVNDLYRVKAAGGYGDREAWEESLTLLVQVLAPFAPHIAEELWQQLGHDESVHTSSWPAYDESYLVSETMTIVVQVNGKLRAQLDVPTDSSEAEIVAAAVANEKVAGYLDGGRPGKVIYVPGRLVNLIP